MSNANIGSGGKVERTIWFIAGIIMALLGIAMGYLCYQWATETVSSDYRYIWVAGAATLSFVLLRGAWFTIFPAPPTPERLFTAKDHFRG